MAFSMNIGDGGVGTAFLDKSFGEYAWYAEDCYRYDEVRCWLEIPSIPPVPKHFK